MAGKKNLRPSSSSDVYVIDGYRTPFIKVTGLPNAWSASDLGVEAVKAILTKNHIDKNLIDEVITGCAMPSEKEANISRLISLRSGLSEHIPAWTVHRNCASGLQSIDCAVRNIKSKKSDIVLAGGTEAMSRAPLMFNADMVKWFVSINQAKTMLEKAKLFLQVRPSFLKPIIALQCGLTDAFIDMGMGQTAEELAYRYEVSRDEMDDFALRSHERAVNSWNAGVFSDEVMPIYDWNGNVVLNDNGVREKAQLTKLRSLKPAFEAPFGKVTAGNSSQITDGAAFLLLASAEAVKEYGLKPIAKLSDATWSGVDPRIMGIGPVPAIAKLLIQENMDLSEIDAVEINEAFAGQVLACLRAMQDKSFFKKYFDLDNYSIGALSEEKLNINGGAIALGHPVGASGARLVLHLAKMINKQPNINQAIASLCIGGGQGGAMLVSRVMS